MLPSRNSPALAGTDPRRRLLYGALGFALAASAWALWWPEEPGVSVPLIKQPAGPVVRAAAPAERASAAASAPGILPSNGQGTGLYAAREPWEPALSDPFGSLPQPAAAPIAAAQPPVVNSPPNAPAPPPRPVYGVVGRMATPGGVGLVLLARTDLSGFSVVAEPGLTLDDGFTVQSVSEGGVRLLHGATGDEVTLPVPPPIP